MTDAFPSGFDPAQGQRNEFDLARHSGRMLNQISHAQITGAGNLLDKAIECLALGDTQRGERLIQRAAQMPYDVREAGSPGVRSATLLVYSVITDELDDSEDDDTAWLDVAISVLPDLDGPGRAHVASVVHGFVLQEGFYDLTAVEKRRIHQVVGDAPLEAELGDVPHATVEQRGDIITSLVMATMALEDAYAEAEAEREADD